MSADEFDPALVEQAARLMCHMQEVCESCQRNARAVLSAVAPALRAEGDCDCRDRIDQAHADADRIDRAGCGIYTPDFRAGIRYALDQLVDQA